MITFSINVIIVIIIISSSSSNSSIIIITIIITSSSRSRSSSLLRDLLGNPLSGTLSIYDCYVPFVHDMYICILPLEDEKEEVVVAAAAATVVVELLLRTINKMQTRCQRKHGNCAHKLYANLW